MLQKTTKGSLNRHLQLVPIAFVGVACSMQVGGADSDESAVGSSQEAFTGSNYYFVNSSTSYSAEIGTSVGRTCFLSGMVGEWANQISLNPTDVPIGGVRINANGNYEIFVASSLEPIGVTAGCVPSAAGRTVEATWWSGDPPTVLGAVTSSRRCFLTRISDVSYLEAGGFRYSSDNVRIWNDGVNWYLGGNQNAPLHSVRVWGQCIDVSADFGSWEWIAPDPGTGTNPLATNPGGVACFLTGVGGHFDQPDYSDGAVVSYNGSLAQFFMNTKNGKTGWANCVQ